MFLYLKSDSIFDAIHPLQPLVIPTDRKSDLSCDPVLNRGDCYLGHPLYLCYSSLAVVKSASVTQSYALLANDLFYLLVTPFLHCGLYGEVEDDPVEGGGHGL